MSDKKYLFYICLAALIFLLPALIKPELLTQRDNDLGRTYVPIFTFLKDSVLNSNQIPLWRPEQMMGEPFLANPVSSVIYPANVLFFLFNVPVAAIVYLILHLFIAGASTYFLARSFNLKKLSCLAAGLFYMFSMKFLVHIAAGHITMITAFSFFPLIFLSVRRILIGFDRRWILIGAMSIWASYVTYPTIAYYSVFFVSLYFLYFVLFNYKKINFLKKVPSFLVMLFLTFGFSAILLFPNLEFAPLSTRFQMQLEDVAQPLWNLKRFTLALLFPYLNFKNIDHESFLYLGLVPSMLGLLGFLKLENSKKIFLAFIIILALLFSAGLSTPFFKLAYNFLPFLKYSRITTRFWFAVALVFALLSAKGLDKFGRKLFLFIILVFLAEAYSIGYSSIQNFPYLKFKNLGLYDYLDSDKDMFRVYCTTYCFNPQLLQKYNIQILEGETPIQYKSFIEFLSYAGNYNWERFAVIFPPYTVWQVQNPPVPNAQLLGLSNVKYVASTYPIEASDFKDVNKYDEIYLYENLKFKPRAYFSDSGNEINIPVYSPNYLELKFDPSTNERRLVLSENYYPGWYAYVDNKKFKVEKEEPVFRALTIPAGATYANLKYEPQSFRIGKIITVSTLCLFLLIWLKRKDIKWPKY